jgi:hypothetical protein
MRNSVVMMGHGYTSSILVHLFDYYDYLFFFDCCNWYSGTSPRTTAFLTFLWR